MSTVLSSEVEAVLGPAVAAVRAFERQRVRLQRLRAALKALRKASALLTPVSPEARMQVEAAALLVEQLQTSEAVTDRWAIARALDALQARGAPTHVVARTLISLGVCSGTGQVQEVRACMTWARKARLRCRQAGACPRSTPVGDDPRPSLRRVL